MSRWKRILKVVALAVFSLAALYLLAANLFLAFGLRWLVGQPDLALGYRRAWTVWPARVHLEGFYIHGASDTLQWRLDTEEATVDVHLTGLPYRKIHLSRVLARELRFRLRLNVMPRDAEDPRNAALPPIAPYEDPPIRLAGVASPEMLRGKYPYWVAQIDDSDVQVTEVWIHHYHFQGNARSRGGFYVAPHRAIAMPPALLEVQGGALTLGERTVARNITGTFDCTIPGFNPDELRDRAVLGAFDSRVRLDAEVPSLAFLQFYVSPSRLRIEDGGGPMHADLGLRDGRLTEGSVVDMEMEKARLLVPGFEITANARSEWRTESDRTVIHSRVRESRVWRTGVEVPPVVITDTTASYTTADADVAAGLGFGGLAARVGQARAEDIRWLTGIHDHAKVRFEAGRVTVSGDLDVSASGKLRSEARGRVDGGRLVVKKSELRGDFAVTSALVGDDVRTTRKVTLKSGVVILADATVLREGNRSKLAARVDVDSGALDLQDGFGMDLGSRAVVTGRDAMLDLLGAPAGAKLFASVVGAEAARGKARLGFHRGMFSMKLLEGECGMTRVKGELRQLGAASEAAFVLKADPFALGIAVAHGKVETDPLPGDKWLEEHAPKLVPHRSHTPTPEWGNR